MNVWKKIFKTLGFLWLLFCLLACVVGVSGNWTAEPAVLPLIVIGWTIGWYVGDILLKALKNKLGGIWFDRWEQTGIFS